MRIRVLRDIMEANDIIARDNRRIFDEHGLFVVNLMSSPGAGKTALLEQTLARLKDEFAMAVIEGDITSQIDAERIQRHGVPVIQINTGGECHLDANMIRNALDRMDLNGRELLFIENVGNLVCPAEFRVGEDAKVMILSVPEGDDKPKKYPLMFHESKVMIINKIDLLSMVDFNVEEAKRAALALNPDMAIFEASCKTGEGLELWFAWLREQMQEAKGRSDQGGDLCEKNTR